MEIMQTDVKKDAMQYSRIFYRKGDMFSGVTGIMLLSLSFLCAAYVFVKKAEMPAYYELLWMLPATYAICMIFSRRTIKEALQSLPVLLIGGLFFVRMVLSPFLYAYSGVQEGITLNAADNTPKAILIMCYECIIIFAILNRCCRKNWDKRCLAFYLDKNKRSTSAGKVINRRFTKADKRMLWVLLICIGVVVCFYLISPHIFDIYRTIFDIGDPDFTSRETAFYLNLYGTTFATKLAMVAANYLINVLRILIPAVVIYWSSKIRRRFIGIIIAIIACISPFFMIDGEIARSFYLPILFAYETIYIYWSKNQKYKMLTIFAFGAGLILVYWVIRYASNTEDASVKGFFQSFSVTVNAYFSGVNVVSGTFNLPNDMTTRINCIMHDILEAVPFSGTIFGIDDINSPVIFNNANSSSGQIPATVGLSSYYFSPLFAPLISAVFAYFSYKSGIKYDLSSRPVKKVCYLLMGLYLSLGLVMYNFPISFGKLIQEVLPIFIIERICYGKEKIK